MELIKTWRRNKTRLKLYYLGGEKLGYKLLERGKTIFEGKDFRPSPFIVTIA